MGAMPAETRTASRFVQTLRALAAPRRAVPLALVGASLLATEWLASASPRALLLDAILLAAFCVCAPALWRALFAERRDSAPHRIASTESHRAVSFGAAAGAWALYAVAAIAIIGGLAVLLPPLLGVRFTYVSEPRSLGVLIVLFLVGGWGLGRDIELEAGVARERARAEQLAIDAEHAQIVALRAQLDPHFLFNTLNAIAEWCREDPIVAERATLDLAALLRAVFDALRSPGWSLAREVALLEQLAALYAVRDPLRYVFRFDIDPATTSQQVPPLVLLPLFENAIKHGPAAGNRGTVRLLARSDDGATAIEVHNPGTFGARREGSSGLASVERRLALTYGSAVRLVIRSADGDSCVALRLPISQSAPRERAEVTP
jgi:hypothetical protein